MLSEDQLNGLIMLLYSSFGAAAKRFNKASHNKKSGVKDSDIEKIAIYKGLASNET